MEVTYSVLMLYIWHIALLLVGIAGSIFQIYGTFQATHVDYSQAVSDGVVQYFYPSNAIPHTNQTYSGLAPMFFVDCSQYASFASLNGVQLTTGQQTVAQEQCLKSQSGLATICYSAAGLTIVASILSQMVSIGGLQKASWYFRVSWLNAVSASVQLTALAIFGQNVWQAFSLLTDCSSLSTSDASGLEAYSSIKCALGNPSLETATSFERYIIYFFCGSLASLLVSFGFWISMYNLMQLTQSRLLRDSVHRSSIVDRSEAPKSDDVKEMDEIQHIVPPRNEIEA
jgi:hypothetical protein